MKNALEAPLRSIYQTLRKQHPEFCAGERIESAFRGDAPLAKALLIADTRSLAPGLRDRYAAAGLVHMLSISGLHVGLIASAALLLFRACRLGRRRATLAAVALTGVYVAIIGAPAPALRAAVMLAVGAAAS